MGVGVPEVPGFVKIVAIEGCFLFSSDIMESVDELFTLKTNFYVGLYEQALAEGQGIQVSTLTESSRIERSEFMYRCHIAMGRCQVRYKMLTDGLRYPSEMICYPLMTKFPTLSLQVALEDIDNDAPVALQAVRLLATYESKPDMIETIMANISMWLSDPASCNNPTMQLITSLIYMKEGSLSDALKGVKGGNSMEQMASTVLIYIKMDRVDLAEKQYKVMVGADEDNILTVLAGAWVNICRGGGGSYQDAGFSYAELIDKYAPTGLLLNGAAVAQMHQNEIEDAGAGLKEANEKQVDADVLINLIAWSRHSGKSDAFSTQFVDQLCAEYPDHPYTVALNNAKSSFKRACSSYTI